jgi:hypothetical protein
MGLQKLIDMARTRLDSGVIYEPRGYYDRLAMTESTSGVAQKTFGAAEVFRNGEPFPVTLTHACFALGYLDQDDSIEDERVVQAISARLEHHNESYPVPSTFFATPGVNAAGNSLTGALLPTWSNKVVAHSDVGTFGTSAWNFPDGKHVEFGGGSFVMDLRDTIQVEVQLEAALSYDVDVSVAFHGIGMLSYRPYLMSSTYTFAQTAGAGQYNIMSPNDIRNDGAEPILVTDMTINMGAEAGAADPTPDIRRLFVNAKIVGNGTNQNWFSGPLDPAVPRCPAPLLGITAGRAIVHEFPTPLTLMPGDSVNMDAQSIEYWTSNEAVSVVRSYLHAGLFGYTQIS